MTSRPEINHQGQEEILPQLTQPKEITQSQKNIKESKQLYCTANN